MRQSYLVFNFSSYEVFTLPATVLWELTVDMAFLDQKQRTLLFMSLQADWAARP